MPELLIWLILIIFAIIFIIAIIAMSSPKFNGKMMSKQIKSVKYMMDNSKDDIENISTNMANATKDGVEITAHAIKKGFTDEESVYCKNCGSKIDADSKFCKRCGKEQ